MYERGFSLLGTCLEVFKLICREYQAVTNISGLYNVLKLCPIFVGSLYCNVDCTRQRTCST
ncbi:hypothetical protein DPMN_095344 [Dreissena polymorpha]|uniref:Uncharacterized protein n=1 Tax=Dreissena polymorpha TaxID=45954 RepID=A0A9D4R2S3_DREPO|nr:hypothetical protein DPMN_095344 [Dreissena polymorpha]